ncbi:hypothetical protein BHM03_00062666, partial [Ensete ventricosum]
EQRWNFPNVVGHNHFFFKKICPSPPSPRQHHRRRCCPCACGDCPCPPATTLPRGGHPCGRHLHKRRPCKRCRCWRPPLQVVALAGGASARRLPSCGRRNYSRTPLAGWPQAAVCRPLAAAPATWPRTTVAPCVHRAAADHPRVAAPMVRLQAGAAALRAGTGRSRSPLCMGALAAADRPLQGAWTQPAAPLQVAGQPCKGVGRGHAQLPLARASFTAKTQQERVE